MSKSRGNYIGIDEPPETIYGKTMSIPDSILMQYYELLTDITAEELTDIEKQLSSGANPMSLKKRLAFDIVKQYHGEKSAQQAEEHFEKTVQNKELPDDIPEFCISLKNTPDLQDILVKTHLVNSRSQASRLIDQRAVTINGKQPTMPVSEINGDFIIKVGKRRFAKIINTDIQK